MSSVLLGAGLIAATACSSEGPLSAPGTAGSTFGGSSGSTSGGASAAGAPAGASAGGTSGGGGAGGSSAGAAGAAGASEGGQGGSSGGGQAGSGGGPSPVRSAGCGKENPTEGARTIQTGGQTARFNVELPAAYDPDEPLPLGFGFHGFGNDECGPNQGECRGFAMLPAVTVYMKSISDGWEQQGVLEQNITFWRDVLALMKNEYCIDESRVFVAGVSSGGQFIEHLTCRFGDELWQTTAVCASVVNAATQNCKGTPPALIIHGVTDQAGNYGEGTAGMFAARNGCSETPPAGLAQAKAELMTARSEERAEHRCLDWDGCTANPVRFCLSSQITYDGLTHGWPQIGGTLIGQFQDTLK